MLKSKLCVLEELQKGELSVNEIAEGIGKSQSWTSELVKDLENSNLVKINGKVELSGTYESSILMELIEKYDIQKVLSGRKEDILVSLLSGPKVFSGIQRKGFPKSTVYKALKDLRETGVVSKTEKGYKIVDEKVRRFLEARQKRPFQVVYPNVNQEVIETKKEDVEGRETAFSAFRRYGLSYFTNKNYLYKGEKKLEMEDVLIHAVLCAKNKKQMAISGVFYLKHRKSLDTERLWKLASKWDCIEKWADLMAFIDRREVRNSDLFLPWDEFKRLLDEYDITAESKYPEESIVENLEKVGEKLAEKVDVFLLGGANLIMRGLKDTTKDIDVVLDSKEEYEKLVSALKECGYEERNDIENMYENLEPSGIFRGDGLLRWDIFVGKVAGALRLTSSMKERSDPERSFGNLDLCLLSPSDIFLFKAVTDREGDFEDAAVLVREGLVSWEDVLSEVELQETVGDKYFSFSILDTLDILSATYSIQVPIYQKLVSYSLENALLITLRQPKDIDDLREELDFPDHRIYNKLRKLEEEGKIEVDRSGKLNLYRTKDGV